MQSEWTKEKSKSNQYLELLPFAFKPASILIGTLAQSQGFCRIIVRWLRTRLSTATRHKVVILHQQGLSQTKISKQTGISRCAVQALLKKHKETGNVEDRRRSGRPRKLSAADEKHLKLISLRNRKLTSSAISSELAETSGTQVHPSTVWRSLARSGLHGRVAAKKPYLRHGNKAKRLDYARKHRNWGAEKWQQVLWTDESKFEIFGCSRRQFVRRRAGERYNNECLQATVKHGGGSLQVWGCISANGVGDLVRINGVLNAEKYRQILIHHAIPSGRRMIGPKFILQHDNDPKHTANVIKNYLQRKEEQEVLEVMVWPPQSPDLNIIESVWDFMKRQKDLRKPTSTEDLWLVLQDVWNNLPAEFLQKLCASVPRRIDAVLKAKGGHTKYWFDLDFSSVHSLHFVNWWK